jgi:hypothetical protein
MASRRLIKEYNILALIRYAVFQGQYTYLSAKALSPGDWAAIQSQ